MVNIILIFTLLGVFLCQNLTYAGDACLRVPISTQDQSFNEKFKTIARDRSFDMTRDVIWRLFQDIDGLMLCPIIETLATKGVFTEDLFGGPSDSRWVAIKNIAKVHNPDPEKNLGNISGAFGTMARQGWVHMNPKNKDTEVMLTQEGWAAVAIVQSGYYSKFAEAIRHMKNYNSYLRTGPPNEESGKALLEFKRLFDKIKRYTNLVRRLKIQNIENRESLIGILKEELDEDDMKRISPAIESIPYDIKIHVIQRALVHIHTYLIGMGMSPAMVALGMPLYEEKDHAIDEVEDGIFKLFKNGDIKIDELDEKKYDRKWLKAAFELLETQGIVVIDRGAARVTELGKEFIQKASGYGVTTAYLRSCEVLEEMLFDNPDPLGISDDKHLDRPMDAWASGIAHKGYLGEYNKETGEITKDGIYRIIRDQFHELPLDEQALGFFTMGAGDGVLVADSIDYILKYTERGKHLDTHPLVIAASDYNQVPLRRERATLKKFEGINGLRIVVMWGDVTDADKFNEDLRSELAKLKVVRFNPRLNEYENVDMSGFNAGDFVHTEEFIPHERKLQVRDEGEAKDIIKAAIKQADRKDLEKALNLLGIKDVPSDENTLVDLVISQWQEGYVDCVQRGRLVDGYVVAADLIEFMKRWTKYAKHGIRILELHTPRANEQYEEVPLDIRKVMIVEKTLSVAYWSTHWMSGQYIMPYAEYNLAMVLSGLQPKKTYLYPASKELPTGVSLGLYQKTENGGELSAESSAVVPMDRKVQSPIELMSYVAGDELPELEEKHFENLRNMEDTIEDFLKNEIIPNVPEWENQGSHKEGDKVVAEALENALKKIAGLDIFGISVPKEYHGLSLSHYYTYRIIKMLSSAWPSLAVTVGVNASVTDAINKFGTKDQKEKILTELASKGLGAIAITEPDAGSDVMNMKAFARKEGNSYILNGTKIFITSAGIASVYLVFAVTDKGEAPGGKKKISAFLVDKDAPGFSIGTIEHKMGQKASPTGELIFEECRIPEENMLGKPGKGMNVLYYMLTGGRIGIASLALGIARAAYDAASEYAKQRRQFAKAIGEFPQIEEKLTNMKFYIDASELLIRYASYLKDQNADAPQDINAMVTAASMSKLFSSEKGNIVVLDALKIHGGYGYTEDYPLERYLRDIIVTMTYEGTSEIQQNIIKKHISLFLNSEIDIEKLIDSYFDTYSTIAGHEQSIETIYEAMNEAKEKLRKAIEEKRITHHDSDLLVDLVITRLMLFKAIFLANQDNVPRETIEKSLDDALLASKFLRSDLTDYEIFVLPNVERNVKSSL